MPAPLRIELTPEEDRTLTELRIAPKLPQRLKDRAHMLRLNAQGWNVPAIAEIFNCQEQTVRVTLRRWEDKGLGGLWEAPGRGAKPKWLEADMQYLEQCLDQEQRTYNSAQLATKLEQERQVNLSADRIRRILQKRASIGNHQTQSARTTRPCTQTTQTGRPSHFRVSSSRRLRGTQVFG